MRALTPSGSANSCNRRAGARQDRHAGSRQQTRSWDGLLRSQEPRDRAEEAAARQQQAETPQHKAQCAGPAVQVDAKAASKTAASGHARPNVPLAPPPRRSLAPPPNGPCSSATLAAETALVAAKATATAVAARLNVGSAASPQPGRRSPCPGQAAEQAVPAAEADQRDGLERAPPPPGAAPAKEPAKAGAIGEAVALAPAVLQMFTLRPLSGSAGNVLTVPYPQKCSDSVLTAF